MSSERFASESQSTPEQLIEAMKGLALRANRLSDKGDASVLTLQDGSRLTIRETTRGQPRVEEVEEGSPNRRERPGSASSSTPTTSGTSLSQGAIEALQAKLRAAKLRKQAILAEAEEAGRGEPKARGVRFRPESLAQQPFEAERERQ